jgi:hypothetical protein
LVSIPPDPRAAQLFPEYKNHKKPSPETSSTKVKMNKKNPDRPKKASSLFQGFIFLKIEACFS